MPKSVQFISDIEYCLNMEQCYPLNNKRLSRDFHYRHGAKDTLKIKMSSLLSQIDVTNGEMMLHFFFMPWQSGHTDISYVARHIDGKSVVGRTVIERGGDVAKYVNRIINREFNVRPE